MKAIIDSLQPEQPSKDLEKTENLDTTMLTYAADVFSGKTLLEDISYSYRKELAVYFNGLVETAKEELLKSLQQEQTNTYDAAMLEVKEYVDKLYDNASIGLNEYDSGLYNGITETCMKLRGFIKARTSKEQSEVDLEKEIEKYFSKWVQGASDEGCCNADSQLVSIYDCHRIARHFYELGRNARKEDTK